MLSTFPDPDRLCTYLTNLTFILPAEDVEAPAVTLRGFPTSVRPELCHWPVCILVVVCACKPVPTTMPPLLLEALLALAVEIFFALPILGILLPMMGCRLGLKGYFFGKFSARCKISRICSEESMEAICADLCCALLEDCLEAVVESVALEPLVETPSCFAALWNSSTACPTTLFIL